MRYKILSLEAALAIVCIDFCSTLKPAMNHVFGEEWTTVLAVRYYACLLCCVAVLIILGIDAYRTIKNKT